MNSYYLTLIPNPHLFILYFINPITRSFLYEYKLYTYIESVIMIPHIINIEHYNLILLKGFKLFSATNQKIPNTYRIRGESLTDSLIYCARMAIGKDMTSCFYMVDEIIDRKYKSVPGPTIRTKSQETRR